MNWCFDCGSALAEAEVEYEDRKDPAIDVGFAFAEPEKLAKAFGTQGCRQAGLRGDLDHHAVDAAGQPGAQRPSRLDYNLVDTEKGLLILAAELQEACLKRYGLTGKIAGRRCKGAALENIRFKHPFYDREAPMYLGEYVTLDTGTGIVHSAPAYGVEDFESCRRYGMKDDEILTPVHGRRQVRRVAAALRRAVDLGRESEDRQGDRGEGRAVRGRLEAHAQLHALLAAQDAGDPARHHAVVRRDGQARRSGESLRDTALRGIENTQFFPSWGQARLHGMIANRPDWTLSRQRQWGVPMPFFLHRETGALHPRTPELLEEVAKRVEQGGIEAWQSVTRPKSSGPMPHYEKSRDTLDVWFDSGSTHYTVLRGSHAQDTRFPADLYLEGSDQHRGWFHSLAARLVHARRRAAVQGPAHPRLRRRRRGPQDVEVEGQRRGAAGGVEHASAPRSCACGWRAPTTRASCPSPTRS